MTQPDVKVSEWEVMQKSLEDLRLLQDRYPDERVRILSKKLRQLIATHGIILDSKVGIQVKCAALIFNYGFEIFFSAVTPRKEKTII